MAKKITWEDKEHILPYGTRENQVWDLDMNEIKTVVNANADSLAGLEGGYQGVLLIADTPINDGYYLAGESGTYTNAGSLVVDLTNTIVFINKVGANYTLTEIDVPVTLTQTIEPANTTEAPSNKAVSDYIATLRGGVVASGETRDVSGGEVYKAKFLNHNYKDGSISREKTLFYKVVSNNLWNTENVEKNVLIQIISGVEYKSVNTSYNYSDYIKVDQTKSYISNHNNSFVLFYDANKVPLSQITNGFIAHQPPVNTVYVRAMQYTNNPTPVYYRLSTATDIADIYKVSDDTLELNEENFNDTFKIQDKNVDAIEYASANLINSVPKFLERRRDTTTGLKVRSVSDCVSELIPIAYNEYYIKKQFGNVYYYGVGGESDFISYANVSGNIPFLIPNNPLIKYVSVQGIIANEGTGEEWLQEYFYKGKVYPLYLPTTTKKLRENFVNTKLHGKKWAVLGDSLTQSFNTYWSYIFPNKGMTVQNLGIATSTIQVLPQAQQYYPMVERYTDIDSDVDVITVFGGVNDADFGVGEPSAIGVPTDTITTTFYGALDTLYKGLLTTYTTKKIGIITPLQRKGNGTENAILSNYVDAIKIVAKRYSLPVLDLYSMSGLNPNVPAIKSAYFSDDIHPNVAGQQKIAEKIDNFIETL